MGLFSKKEETKNDAPPVPPSPDTQAPAPPAPPASTQIPKPTLESNNLSAPPIPGGSLADIKEQVASKPGNIESPVAAPQELVDTSSTPQPASEEIDNDDDEDSLFDFSELDVNTPLEANAKSEDDSEESDDETTHKDEEDVDLSFIKHRHKHQTLDTYFVTTSQFKALLEIVEYVKNKVKDASETHLKLLDIKAEEDIEFENLRKDFQFIEDKLYEVDSIIFDK